MTCDDLLGKNSPEMPPPELGDWNITTEVA